MVVVAGSEPATPTSSATTIIAQIYSISDLRLQFGRRYDVGGIHLALTARPERRAAPFSGVRGHDHHLSLAGGRIRRGALDRPESPAVDLQARRAQSLSRPTPLCRHDHGHRFLDGARNRANGAVCQ